MGSPRMPLAYASTSCPLTVARRLPPTQVGLLDMRISLGGPGWMRITFETAGALPASSRAMNTTGSAKV